MEFEIIMSLILSVFGYVFFYGRLVQTVKSNKEIIDNRIQFLQEQLDSIHKEQESVSSVLIDIKVKMSTVAQDCSYIKEQINKIEKKTGM